MPIVAIVRFAAWIAVLVASAFIVRAKCRRARASAPYLAGALLAAAVNAFEAALVLNASSRWAMVAFGMLPLAFIPAYLLMASVLLPGLGLAKSHGILKAGIIALIAIEVAYALAGPAIYRKSALLRDLMYYAPYVLILSGSFARPKQGSGPSGAKKGRKTGD